MLKPLTPRMETERVNKKRKKKCKKGLQASLPPHLEPNSMIVFMKPYDSRQRISDG